MKTPFILSAVVALAMAASASAQTVLPPEGTPPYPRGVGPVISGSVTTGRLPEAAVKFAAKLYPEAAITAIDENFSEQEFEVTLANGVEMEFDSAGNWQEIEAPQGRCLDEATVKALIPDRAYNELLRLDLAASVDDVKRSPRSFKVGIRSADIDDLRFDPAGTLVEIDID